MLYAIFGDLELEFIFSSGSKVFAFFFSLVRRPFRVGSCTIASLASCIRYDAYDGQPRVIFFAKDH